MKILRILLGTSLVLPTLLVSCANSNPNAIEKHDKLSVLIKHGQNGCNGQNGENGQNGGNGGHGGNSDWGRGGDGGNGGNASVNIASTQTDGRVDEWEYKILKDTCRQIIANTVSKFYGPSSVLDENMVGIACKELVSDYLLHIETPAARQTLQEYENVKWSYPAIAGI